MEETSKKGIPFVGADMVPATYADNFTVADSDKQASYSLYFYQAAIPDFEGSEPRRFESVTNRCVARIVLNPKTFDSLLGAMAKTRNATLTFLPADSAKKEE